MADDLDSRDEAVQRAFGRRVQELRQHAGLSRVQLGDQIDPTEDQVKSIELGRSGTSILVAARIASTFGITLPDLFDLEEQPANDTEHRRALRELVKTLRPESAHRIKLLKKLWATVRPELR